MAIGKKKVECKECENILHLKCKDLTNNQHWDRQKGKSSFHCKYCREYWRLKCNKHVYDHHKSVCCNKCDQWILIGCAKITEQEYKKMTQTNVILFPETRAIACARIGTHASKFMCAIYCTCKIIVFSHKEKFFIEGFSIEHN